jgi:hypothetical protein
MNKTAHQIAWSILVKLAAGEAGNPEMWRKMVNRIAKARGFPEPTNAEFKQMFPKGWETTKNLEEAYQSSPWFKKHHTASASRSAPPPRGFKWTPHDIGNARLNRRGSYTSGHLGVGMGAIPLAVGIAGSMDASPEERMANLGVTGGLAGLNFGNASKNYRLGNQWKKMEGFMRSGDIAKSTSMLNKIKTLQNSKIHPGAVGGLAGVGLGLGGAALWNKLTENPDMKKAAGDIANTILQKRAAITNEEIASGLGGSPMRPDISEDDVRALSSMMRERALHQSRYAPLKHGLGGGALGGLLGLSFGAAGNSGRIGAGGALLGSAIGGGLGYLSGRSHKKMQGQFGENLGEDLGGIAQTGRIPYDLREGVDLESFLPYAKGIQGTPAQIDPNEERQMRKDLTRQLMRTRGTEGALTGAALSSLGSRYGDDGEEQGPSMSSVLGSAAIHGGLGALEGRGEARSLARKVLDLKQRGYGTLADRYLADQEEHGMF